MCRMPNDNDSEILPGNESNAEATLLLRLRDTPEIFEIIRGLTPSEIESQKKLREQFDDELVRAALSVHDARVLAASLLPDADRLWLTRTGLEQSTAWEVAQHKSLRFSGEPIVIDLCCGIGVDAAAIAQRSRVLAVDRSPAMCMRCGWNADIWGCAENLESLCGDVAEISWAGQMVHADPDRRSDGHRPVKRLEQYRPDLEWMQALTNSARGGAIKVGPASNFLQKFPGAEIELISLHGECREATVWFGSLAGSKSFRATVLPSGETLSDDPLSAWTRKAGQVLRYLHDPDPAVVRSGLLDVMAEQHDLLRLDDEEEYLTSETLPQTGFVTSFEVEAVLPNSQSQLRRYCSQMPASRYEVKCRRIPTDAAAISRTLPKGDHPVKTLFVARVAGRAAIVVTRRLIRGNSTEGVREF